MRERIGVAVLLATVACGGSFTLRDITDLRRSPVEGAPAGPCRVVAMWEGVKQGAPNVIP